MGSRKKQRRNESLPKPHENESVSHSPSSLDISLEPAPFYYYKDRSQERDSNPSTPIIPIGNIISLPGRMHVILDIPDFADIVSWQPHGRSFQIHKPDEFETRVLPQFWKRCTLRSFIRQLDVWGFLPVTMEGNHFCYYHELFLRGLTHLCKKMFRSDRKTAPKDKMRTAKRRNEPNLHAISEIHPLPQRDQSHHLQMLRASVLSGPDARMVLNLESGDTEQTLPQNNNASRVQNSVQDDTTRTVESHSNTVICNTVTRAAAPASRVQNSVRADTTQSMATHSNAAICNDISDSMDLVQQQISLQSPVQQQSQHEEVGTMQNMIQCQQQFNKFQTFILPLVRMGLGAFDTWRWLTNWWSTFHTAPIVTVDEDWNEMQDLPEHERVRARADIVGSSVQGDVRTAEELQIALSLFRYKLDNTPMAEKVELGEASNHCAGFIDNRWLMLFLQVENFDVEAASKRIIEYWRMRVDIFGRDLAFLPFTIQNMFPQEQIRILKMGFLRILPVKDLHGRSIFFLEPGKIHGKSYNANVMARAFLYVFHAALEHQDIGENGVVLIVDHSTAQPMHDKIELTKKMIKSINSLPFSIKAIHFCGFRKFLDVLIIPFANFFMSRFLRCRIVQHKEDGQQLLYRFRQYGIPPERLPAELGGMIELDHERWVNERLANGL